MSEKELETALERAKAEGLVTDDGEQAVGEYIQKAPARSMVNFYFGSWEDETMRILAMAEKLARLNPENKTLAQAAETMRTSLVALARIRDSESEIRFF